ncbi:sugar ABC transporter permease [Acidiphilium sp. AL]|uniref:Sugar ABC transporter permease n=1 Tax=Acidiphilium iwatense TaxID=768198 RepID=A0ABS9DYQ0_9PROT|nr:MULTISPECIES: sugar ABC transporter permease [Acidiphilium]MCF3946557.1 sugar ABC transporter permease [Acidiphilium iwatense]MCU4160262.1 sugar ABC transporter permease [Acidiphilium sp. AL]
MSEAITKTGGLRVTGRSRGSRQVNTLPLLLPAVALLLLWSVLPLLRTLFYSFEHYNLMSPPAVLNGGLNYRYLFTDVSTWVAIENSVILVVGVLFASIVFGTLIALLLNNDFPGRNVARLMAIAPFFVMSPVAALIWKNLLLDPVSGLFGWLMMLVGLRPIAWFSTDPMTAVIIIYSWRWIPFATLILLTALQSLDTDQLEAARMDGAHGFARLRYIVLPHLGRPIAIVIMLESIFLLSAFAVIYTTTNGGPGDATTTLTYLIFIKALNDFSIGSASAAGVFAIVLANILAFFLIRAVSKNLQR